MVADRIAGAPISWGVSEVPGWGVQLPVGRVLSEMREIGLAATEFGPDGFLPGPPAVKAEFLSSYGLRAVGGFLPVVLHEPAWDPLPVVRSFANAVLAASAGVVVVAAASGADGYDARPDFSDAQWGTLLDNLNRIDALARDRGVVAAIHPHVGTVIESGAEVERVLRDSPVGLCVDTGHLLVGGADPVGIVRRYANRVVHVHLKDVDAGLAQDVLSGRLPFGDAVAGGLFRPLGQGDVEIGPMVRFLETAGYRGWYVLEQDLKLAAEPEGEGPAVDVRASFDYLVRVAQ